MSFSTSNDGVITALDELAKAVSASWGSRVHGSIGWRLTRDLDAPGPVAYRAAIYDTAGCKVLWSASAQTAQEAVVQLSMRALGGYRT